MSVQHFFKSDEVLPWWNFTARGKELLQSTKNVGQRAI